MTNILWAQEKQKSSQLCIAVQNLIGLARAASY
jgi:hypothetical protein